MAGLLMPLTSLSGQSQRRNALVLYGSETGNAQDLAGDIGRMLERQRFSTRVDTLDSIGLNELTQFNLVVFVTSTTGQGEFPNNARLFWRKMRNAKLPPRCMSLLKFASFGLGDSSYPHFNWAHRKLFNRLHQLGATPICQKGESDAQHPDGIDGCFIPWLVSVKNAVLELFPLPEDVTSIPDGDFIHPAWTLGRTRYAADPLSGRGSLSSTRSNLTLAPEEAITGTNHKLTVTLIRNERLTPVSHWQDVRLFEFSTPAAFYKSGDVLTINPRNTEEDVQQLINLMGWNTDADCAHNFVKTIQNESSAFDKPPPILLQEDVTLRQLLIENIDFNAIPRRSFFAQIAHFTTDETQRARILEFTNPEYLDELYDYTTRPRRSILEVLQEFYSVKIPVMCVATVFPIMRGRQFSIASGGNLNFDEHGNGRIQLLVAIVKYRTVIRKIRQGLCTRYLAGLKVGDQLDVMLCRGGMRHAPDRPAIMVGPGTGVAPLRAMIYERSTAVDRDSTAKHDIMLFYGGRNRKADFFFQDEWPDMFGKMGLEVVTAFSRDQAYKVYVQDAIRKHAPSVYKVLQNGYIYICGSSGKMPQAVREALIEVVQEEGGITRGAAEHFLKTLEKERRYQQETW